MTPTLDELRARVRVCEDAVAAAVIAARTHRARITRVTGQSREKRRFLWNRVVAAQEKLAVAQRRLALAEREAQGARRPRLCETVEPMRRYGTVLVRGSSVTIESPTPFQRKLAR
jgi:hypothetical protein